MTGQKRSSQMGWNDHLDHLNQRGWSDYERDDTEMAKQQFRPKRERMTDEQVRAQGFNPFVRPEHVSEGQRLKLTGFNRKKDQGTPREQIVCEVETEAGDTFDLGVRVGSPDHRILHKALG